MTKAHILIIEDDHKLSRNLARYLLREGFKVRTATCALEGTRKLSREDMIDVILLDIHLPDGNGLDFFRRVRTLFPRIKAVVMSGQASTQDREQARHLGITQFLTKPFALSDLTLALDELDSTQ